VVASTGSAGSFEISERYLTMGEVVRAEGEGRLLESFGAGTAVSISPVKSILYRGKEIAFPTGEKVSPPPLFLYNRS
jgi:branched-chain amino acid aminotransferase